MQQRLAAVGEMAAGIAHEIRNPLASMSGSIQILRQELPLSAEQEQLMDIVLRESERLNTTIRSFLAYARPQRFAIARFDVRRALNDTALLLRNSAERARRRTSIDVDVPATELWYEADEGQIKQIVWNLATNGLRAMPDGGRLRLAGGVEPATGGVVLTVQDEGIGIRARRPRRPVPAVSRHASPRAAASAWRSCTASSPTTTARFSVSSHAGQRHDRARCGCRRAAAVTT